MQISSAVVRILRHSLFINLFTVFLKDIRLKPITHCYLYKCHFVVNTSALLIKMFETRKFRLTHC